MKNVEARREKCWDKIINEHVVIPANSIKLYDSDGKLTGRLLYKDGEVTHQQHPSVANTPSNDHSSSDDSSSSTTIPLQEAHTNPPTLQDDDVLPSDLSLAHTEESHSVLPLLRKSKDTAAEGLEITSINSPGCSYQPTQSSFHSPALTESSLHHQSDHIILASNSEHNVDGLKTTLAASITNIIDCDATLREFDELRSVLKEAKKSKSKPHNLKDKVVRYKTLMAKLSLQILGRRNELDTAIKAFEHQYFAKYSKLPKREPTYTELLKKRNYAKAALRAMNVSL
jgi:hypothetical protein